jgi:hypothetical protein
VVDCLDSWVVRFKGLSSFAPRGEVE